MKAVVMAGGQGMRLRPLTFSVPKPLLPIKQKPILEYVIRHLKRHGIKDLIFTISYLGYQIKNYFGDGSAFGVSIEYSEEKEPLGTAGSLVPLKEKLSETFLVVSGDVLSSINLGDFIKFHKSKKSIATIALRELKTHYEYGVVDINDFGKVIGFKEKPLIKHIINAGMYCLEPKVFKFIKKGSDFSKNVFPKLLKNKMPIYGYVFYEKWMDIGTPEVYYKYVGCGK